MRPRPTLSGTSTPITFHEGAHDPGGKARQGGRYGRSRAGARATPSDRAPGSAERSFPLQPSGFDRHTLQNQATQAWNIHTALYYKAGGIPWRLLRDPAARISKEDRQPHLDEEAAY